MIDAMTLRLHDAAASRMLDRLWAMHYRPGNPAAVERAKAEDAVAAYGRLIHELAFDGAETVYRRSALLAESRLRYLQGEAVEAVDRAVDALDRDLRAAAA